MTREQGNLVRALEVLKATVDGALEGARTSPPQLNAHSVASSLATNAGNVVFMLGELAQHEHEARMRTDGAYRRRMEARDR